MKKKKIAQKILERNDFEPLDVQIAEKHMPHIKAVADELGLSLDETATFLLYSYINDLLLFSKLEAEKLMPRN